MGSYSHASVAQEEAPALAVTGFVGEDVAGVEAEVTQVCYVDQAAGHTCALHWDCCAHI